MQDSFSKVRGMEFPRNVIVGHDVLKDVVPLSRQLGFGREGVIITGDNTYASAGKDVEAMMQDAGFDISVHFTGNATEANVDKAIDDSRSAGARFILGVGGGTKIDIAKLVAANLDIPFISIPTTASHDGIASGRASLRQDRGPKSIDAVTPMGVIADTAVIMKAPYRHLASGCADVLSNLTALKDWDFAHRLKAERFSSSAYSLSLHAATTILENASLIKPGVEESVWLALRPIIISGVSMSVAGSSRPTSGSEHMFSHALDIMGKGTAMHGEQCGVGSIMMMYLHGGDWPSIKWALTEIGAPTTAEGLGLSEDDIIEALITAHKIRKDRFTILGDNGLNRISAEAVARKTGVIG